MKWDANKTFWVHEMENKELKFKRTLKLQVRTKSNHKNVHRVMAFLTFTDGLSFAYFSNHQHMYIQKNDLECALTTWNIIYENVYFKNYKLHFNHDVFFPLGK